MPLPVVPKSDHPSYFHHQRLILLILESHIMESHNKCSFEPGLFNTVFAKVIHITEYSSNMFFLLAM